MTDLFRFLTLGCVIVLCACSRDPNPSNYTVTRPVSADLEGTYAPSPRTTELLKATGKYSKAESSITLNSDGSIVIKDVPDWWLSSLDSAKGQFDNASGTWSIDKNKQWWLVVASFPTSTSQFTSQVPQSGHVTAMLSLVGQKPPYSLQVSISDPNADVAMIYERVKK